MRHIDKIISRIETLEDIPISEEMLGAYFESKLTDEESDMVRGIIDSDLFLINLEQEVKTMVEELVNVDNSIDDGIEHLMSIELPEVFIVSDMDNNISYNSDDILSDTEIEYTDLVLDEICESTIESIDNQFENENIE